MKFDNYNHYNHYNQHNHHNNTHNHHNHNNNKYYSSTSINTNNGNHYDNNNFLSTNNNYNGNNENHNKNEMSYQNGKIHSSKVPSILVNDTDRNTNIDHSSGGIGGQMIAKRHVNDEKREQYRTYIEEMFKLYPTIKWPLYNTWSFWFSTNDRSKKDWKDNLIRFADVSYIEDFWSVFNYLVNPSNLEIFTDLGLFKKGIMPMWEDQENKNGGRWLLSLNIHQRKLLDEIWLNSLLALIGDYFCGISGHNNCDNDHVCDNLTGICVQNRPKTDKIALWTKDYKNERITRIIGRKWKENVELINQTITFEPHDSQFARGSTTKFIYEE